MAKILFSLGRLVATPGVLAKVSQEEIAQAITRHVLGDWGLVPPEDARLNAAAVLHGDRILSAYDTAEGVRFWIITEADRTATTALLPEEY